MIFFPFHFFLKKNIIKKKFFNIYFVEKYVRFLLLKKNGNMRKRGPPPQASAYGAEGDSNGNGDNNNSMKWWNTVTIILLLGILGFMIIGGFVLLISALFGGNASCNAHCTKPCYAAEDCKRLRMLNFTSLEAWDDDNDYVDSYRMCHLGKCFYKLILEMSDITNFTEFAFDTHWKSYAADLFPYSGWENDTEPYAFEFADGAYPIIRTDMTGWGDPVSQTCMSFIHPDDRGCLVPLLTFWGFSGTDFLMACRYTFDCYKPLNLNKNGAIYFPALAA